MTLQPGNLCFLSDGPATPRQLPEAKNLCVKDFVQGTFSPRRCTSYFDVYPPGSHRP
ncbi:hypothetical protein CCP3SC15_530003 [Gammaproteobacteria bacterium]